MNYLDGKHGLTATTIRDLITYDPDTGIATWKVSISNRKPVGAVVGDETKETARGGSRRRVGIFGHRYLFHRVIWLYMTGEWPGEHEIDHINNDSTDNRWTNLRLASPHQNQGNKRRSKHNTSGHKGVSLHKSGKWRARISTRSGEIGLGLFDTAEEAAEAYAAGARRFFGEFARAA